MPSWSICGGDCFTVTCLIKHNLMTAPDSVTRQPWACWHATGWHLIGSCSRHCQRRDYTLPQALPCSSVHIPCTKDRCFLTTDNRCSLSTVTRRACITASISDFSAPQTAHIGSGADRTTYPLEPGTLPPGTHYHGGEKCVKCLSLIEIIFKTDRT